MKHVFSSALLAAVALSIAAVPLACHAAALDAPLACSINAFRPAKGADLSAFGFHVFAVVGFEKDDPMFRTGAGEPLANSAYGAVVFGSDSSVQDAVTQAGSTAIVHHVGPHITAIFCKRN
jgi:hypothetical protein